MPYKIVTRINDRFINEVKFDGEVESPETTTVKPVKHHLFDYWYFVVKNTTWRAKKTDVMTIEQVNLYRVPQSEDQN